MQSSVVVKLGGSAITDKSGTCIPKLGVIHRVAGELADYRKQIILLHGGGSYAHPFATRKRVQDGFKSQLATVSEIELNLDSLTRIVGVALSLRGCYWVPIRPMSFMTLRNGKISGSFFRPITAALRQGLVPIIHGDLCLDEDNGLGVVSADRIASLLGTKLPVSKVLFGCDVDGVYKGTGDSRVIREVNRKNHARVLSELNDAKSDATGGMWGKVREAIELARTGVESYIFNLNTSGNLTRLLKGDRSIGTRFLPWGRRSG